MLFYQFLKYPFFGRFMVKWRSPLTADQNLQWSRHETKSNSGGNLKILFSKSQATHPKGTIVLGHPMGKEAKGYFIKRGYTQLLLANGFHVVVFDINGFGESSFGNFSFHDDIVAAGLYAKKLMPDLPIGYFGISLGGQYGTLAFTQDHHPYQFAIVESAATSLDEFWKQFRFAYQMLLLLNWLLPRYSKKIKMIDRIKEAKHLKGLLLIYSKTDAWVPVEMGEKFLKNSPVPTELWLVDDAPHAAIMESPHSTAYRAKIVSFLNQHAG